MLFGFVTPTRRDAAGEYVSRAGGQFDGCVNDVGDEFSVKFNW